MYMSVGYYVIVSYMTCTAYNVQSIGDENGTDNLQMGRLGSDFCDHIDRNMWAENKDNGQV